MESSVDLKIVSPGDTLLKLPTSGNLRVGSGVSVENGELITSKCGVARQTRAGKVWVESRQKRYIPTEGEAVVGLITERYGDSWNVDIRGPFPAKLDALAFEGVSRRSRPNLQPGDLVYARVTAAPRDANPEIVCMDDSGLAAGFGHLKSGYLVDCSTALARKLLGTPTTPVLAALGAAVQYEVAIGLNGRLWVNAVNVTTTILVSQCIINSEYLAPAQAELLVKRVASAAKQAE
jgi:exosome complex component RRP40